LTTLGDEHMIETVILRLHATQDSMFATLTITIQSLTVLLGANASGKTASL